jgi:hypothetical protein
MIAVFIAGLALQDFERHLLWQAPGKIRLAPFPRTP